MLIRYLVWAYAVVVGAAAMTLGAPVVVTLMVAAGPFPAWFAFFSREGGFEILWTLLPLTAMCVWPLVLASRVDKHWSLWFVAAWVAWLFTGLICGFALSLG
jgi:hypothetical protein